MVFPEVGREVSPPPPPVCHVPDHQRVAVVSLGFSRRLADTKLLHEIQCVDGEKGVCACFFCVGWAYLLATLTSPFLESGQ